MKCPECGLKQVPETARFCPQCGAAIPEESRPSTQIQAQVHVREVRDHAKATALEIGKVEGSVSIVQEARPKEHPRVRHQVLERVRRTWLEAEPAGLLHGAVSVEPGLVPRPDLVEHPRGVPYAGISVEVLPTHTAIADVFTQAGGSLLIVGAPGSGKKGRLLELTHVLIERAAEDADEPMPVVLYLSTWSGDLPGEGQASADRFARWLADELSEIYTGALGTRLCKEWLENRRLVLLLYGLDQVGQEHQETCIRAINHFVKEYGPVEIVVCSNTRDYEALKARLRMQGAVELQSLTDGQVDDYLANAGPGAATLRAALQSDEALRELARSPLYLGLMLDIYRGQPVEAAQALSTIEARRADLWHDYVERMFERESAGNERRYTQEQTTGWLAWLAHVMKQRGQALFMLERMQPDWLSPAAQRLHAISTGLIVVLAVGLPASLAVYFLTGVLLQERAFLRYGPYYGKIVGPVFGLALGLSAWLIAKRTFGLASVLAVGVSFGAAMAIGVAKVFDPVTGVIAGAVFGSVFMALFVAYSRQRSSGRTSAAQIQTIEIKNWDWLQAVRGLVIGVVCAVVVWLLFELIVWVVQEEDSLAEALEKASRFDTFYWTYFGRGAIIAFGLLTFWLFGFRGGEVRIDEQAFPNQGIRRSAQTASLIALLAGLFVGLPFAWAIGWGFGLASGAVSGLLGGIWFGGFACIQHGILRLILCSQGYIPWDYVRFLDHAASLGFLRKRGGAYEFLHQGLQEHFARLASGQPRSGG